MDPLIEGVPPELLGIGAGWLLVCLGVLAIMRGLLVPRSTLKDVIHDRDEWRTESRLKDAQLAEKDKQLDHLAEVGRTVDSIMRSLQDARQQESP
jgi:hypothetical protein